MKFLFFLERELHLPVLAGVMAEIHARNLGEIAVASVSYHPSEEGIPGRGLRPEILRREVPVPFRFIENPYAYGPDITFLADFSYQFVEGLGTLVNIGHGTICKGWYFSKTRISRRENCADLLCVPGEVHKRVLQEQMLAPIAVTGMPKLDPLFQGRFRREIVLTEMGLDPARQTVLFAPTFNPELSIVPWIKADLRKYIGLQYNLIIKLHGAAPEEWKTAYRQLAQTFPNTAYSESTDISPAFAAADVMLTDVSSVIYEFLALDKPVVLFDSPQQKDYYSYRDDDLEYLWRDVGIRCNDIRQIPEAITRSLSTPLSPTTREIAADFISVRDGSSASRIVDAALRVHHEAKPRGTVILHGDSEMDLQRRSLLYRTHYQIVTAGPAGCGAELIVSTDATPFAVLQQAMSRVSTDPVFYIDTRCELSPLLIPLLTAHLRILPDVGVVFPLIDDRELFEGHQIRYYIRLNESIPREAIGLQLTYSLIGEARETENFTLPVFGFLKAVWETGSPLADPGNVALSRFEFLRKVYLSGRKAYLALDTYVQRNSDFSQASETPVPSMSKTVGKAPEAPISDRQESNREQELLRAIERDPSNIDGIKELIRHYFQEQRFEMVDIYEAMIPFDPEIAYYSSIALEQQGFAEKAWEKINSIDVRGMENVLASRILTQKGKMLLKRSAADEAIHCLREALLLKPDNTGAMVHLGTACMLQNDAAGALSWFGKAMEREPNNPVAIQGTAMLYQNDGQFRKAAEYYGKLLSQQHAHLAALQGLMTCAYQTREFGSLIQALERYLSDHDDLQMRFVLSGVLFETGRTHEALIAVNAVLAGSPDFPGAAELRERIMSRPL